jgi:hypothetical protein
MEINIKFNTEETISDEKLSAVATLLGLGRIPEASVSEEPALPKKTKAKAKEAPVEVKEEAPVEVKEEAPVEVEEVVVESDDAVIPFDELRTLALQLAEKEKGSAGVLNLVKRISGESTINPKDSTYHNAIAEAIKRELGV